MGVLSKLRRLGPLVVFLAAAACGCSKLKSDDDDDGGGYSGGGGGSDGTEIFSSSEFPGSSTDSGDVASDGLAFSVSGESYLGDIQFVHNGNRCAGIATYRTDTGQFFAHYWNGDTWTPPVALKAPDVTIGTTQPGAVVVFLNAQDNADDDATQRDGDALIFWRVGDFDGDGAGPADGANTVLISTYFDASESDSPATNWGFQEFGTRLSGQDEFGENVSTVAVVSDGLCGEARWAEGASNYLWGDLATSVVVVWRQGENNDGAPGAEDQALYAVRFDFEEDLDPAFPLTPSAEVRLVIDAMGASDTGLDSQETLVAPLLVTYNDVLFFIVTADNSTAGTDSASPFTTDSTPSDDSDDQVLQSLKFDLVTGDIAAPENLHPAVASSLDTVENHATFLQADFDPLRRNGFYGLDEGLAVLTVFQVCVVEDPDGDGTDPEDQARLHLTEIHQATGAAISAAFVDLEDPAAADRVGADRVDTRISRNGDYVQVAWLEPVDSGGSEDLGLWTACYHATRFDPDDATLPPIAVALDPPLPGSFDLDGFDVQGFMFQDGLGYVCGAQSDPDSMNVFYIQPGPVTHDVFRVRLDVDPEASSSVSTTSFFETFLPGDQLWTRVHEEHADFNAVDAGFLGEVFAVYRKSVSAASPDYRVFARRTGGTSPAVEIDSAVDTRQTTLSPGTPILLVGTPRGEEIGVLDDSERLHAYSVVHVFFREFESTETSGLGFALRTRAYLADPGLLFADAFVPTVAPGLFEPPFDLDLPGLDPSTPFDAEIVGIGVSGVGVGVWFTELKHLYYQQYSGGAEDGEIGWINFDGVSAPVLVDDDTPKELNAFEGFFAKTCVCEDLGCAVTFWSKAFDSGGGPTIRLQVRVRDD